MMRVCRRQGITGSDPLMLLMLDVGFFATSESTLAIFGGLGADFIMNAINYANASSCKPKEPCQ